MVGFPEFFDVPNGHKVLQHPLYLKWNTYTALQIEENESPLISWERVKADLSTIMMTNDNMAIIWYMRNLLNIAVASGMIEPR